MKTLLLVALAFFAATARAASGEKPLFASSDVLHLTIRGPLPTLIRYRTSHDLPATIAVAGTAEQDPITLSTRGITRRRSDVCQFPPLKVRFTGPLPAQSPFAGQKTLKLVTHCRNEPGFQQHTLVEYSIYRMFNLLSPASFRVRLASIDYVDQSGHPMMTRYGFFIEDLDDVAKRNGLKAPRLPALIPVSALSPPESALYAVFEDMIANHDWSMRAGPQGSRCCHNAEMLAPAAGATSGVIPIPYDFDFSGLVNAPYADPPVELNLDSVRQHLYRGYCIHNPQALAAAAKIRASQAQLFATLSQTPGLTDRTRHDATGYLQDFFADIATDDSVRSKLLKRCV